MELQRLKLIKPSLISEIALRCGDTEYRDFQKEVYERAILFANRQIAKKYDLLKRYMGFKSYGTEEQQLTILSFAGEYRVLINGSQYDRVNKHELDSTKNQYYLYYDSHSFLFNYTNALDGDNVVIYYTADIKIDDYDLEQTAPIIPGKYEDEQIAIAVSYLIRLAKAKFIGHKLEKYERLRTEYGRSREKEYDSQLAPTTKWAQIKPFKYI